jgi:hypothetical protein
VVVSEAPLCQFYQKLEDDFTKFADQADIDVLYRSSVEMRNESSSRRI